jgi:hypothetical protein
MFNANKTAHRDDGGGRYHHGCDRHHYRAAIFDFFPPLGQMLTGGKHI